MINTFLSFVVCIEIYSVNMPTVLEALQNQHFTVQDAPDPVKGIINLTSKVFSVFKSCGKFYFPIHYHEDFSVTYSAEPVAYNKLFRIREMVSSTKDVILADKPEIKPKPPTGKSST